METPGKTPLVRHPAFWIVIGGLILRLWNIHWGLPDVYEEAYPFSVAWKFWTWGAAGMDFNPHFFNYPALTFYLNFLVQGLHYLAGSVAGVYPTPASFNQAFSADPSSFIVLGRMVSVIFDLGTIYIAYRLGDLIGGKSVGAVAGILLAVNPLHIREAHLINVDTPLAFFTLLALYLLYRLVTSPKPKRYAHFGIVAGLAVASKYTGAVLLLGFAIVVLLLWLRKSRVRPTIGEVLTTFLWAGLVFHAVNPFTVLDLNEFLADIGFERYHAAYGHLGINAAESTLGFYFLTVLPGAIGIPLMAIFIATIALVIARRDWKVSFLLLFAAVYLVGIGLWEMRAERYLLPLIPVFIVVCSYGIAGIARMVRQRLPGRATEAAAVTALAAIAAFVPAEKTWTYQRSYDKPDTRTVARELIRKNLPGGSAIVLSPMGLNLGSRYSILNLPFNPVETERLTPFYDERWYAGFDLAVMSDYDYARYELEPERFREILGFYRVLKETRPVVAEIVPGENQNGPKIWIVDLQGSEDSAAYPPELFANLSRVGHEETVLSFLYNLSEVLFAKDRLPKCRQVLRAGLAIAPADPRFLTEMAWTCFRMGDYPAASDAVDDALTARPGRPELVSLKGSILLKLDRYDEAERYLLTALSLNNRLLSAYIDLGEVYERQGKPDMAIGTLERVLTLVPPGGPEAAYIRDRINTYRQ